MANFVNFPKMQSLYTDDHVGIIAGLEAIDGTYTTNSGEVRPKSWTVHFTDGMRFNWPTWFDKETGALMVFAPRGIDMNKCVADAIPVHMWREDGKVFVEVKQD